MAPCPPSLASVHESTAKQITQKQSKTNVRCLRQEEGIRVLARATLHQDVYALTSGGGVTRRRPRPPPPLPPPLERAPTEPMGESAAADPLNCSTVKRNQVAPSPKVSATDAMGALSSPSQSQAAPFVAGTVEATAGGDRAAAAAATAGTVVAHPSSAMTVDGAARTQPAALPTIQRGLRASRIVPAEVADALTHALKSSTPTGEGSSERSVVSSTIAAVLNNPARVHPAQDDLQGAGKHRSREGLGGGGGRVGGVLETPVRSRPPPAVTNLDLSPSPSLSDSSSLPKLGLEIAQSFPVPSVPSKPASPAGDSVSLSTTEASSGGEQEGVTMGCREGDNAAARHGWGDDSDNVLGKAGAGVTPGDPGRGGEPALANGGESRTSGSETTTGEETVAAAAAAATEAAAAATRLEKNIALGRRHAGQLRDRLNRTLSPQGVEITTVMIRSLELPPDIADQMSGTTLYASLNDEQRAVKKSEAQRVKHEEEVLSLRQEYEIERALTSREGDEEVLKVRT